MSDPQPVREETFDIRTRDADEHGRATLQGLADAMQDAAGQHARQLGVGFEWLAERRLAWVLGRLQVRMQAWPRWPGRWHVTTWPAGVESLAAVRDFEFHDDRHTRLGVAATAWVLLDTEARRPVRLIDEVRQIRLPDRPRTVPEPFLRLTVPEAPAVTVRAPVLRQDLDVNGHVNNARYLAWLTETVPEPVWRGGHLAEVDVAFRAEALLGDTVVAVAASPQTDPAGVTLTHALLREADQRVLVLARTRWLLPART